MTEFQVSTPPRTPGIVLFTAVLNFITASFSLLGAAFAAAVLVFGNILGLADFAARQLSKVKPDVSATYGLNFIFILLLLFSLAVSAYFLMIALGLLRGKKYAWFIQIAMSVLGLVGFPIWTVLNGIILFCFFREEVRDFFKV
ncbi:MAG TPA: hypothetical protein VL404_06175 [Candidatus Eisenbacteria bacterium]|nr:hypothetical protein [Candidatus Eisenbacteria bacterium]